ncbi:hypothetical protein AX769_14925 [Frondihabitans sp. PAMC 28766]|uniref:hypothetical protein n=1 Tax=Frondihabitans sp. PAMC 28766 TaxID=1795630 RepID=UPI00078B6B83|nr:hypothetical protein [Frondihabitans sp. PAMC 28766]AMM21192.1 hypothetical protein AX769_14925 [Frondihabitans sp. PAMC 28766]
MEIDVLPLGEAPSEASVKSFLDEAKASGTRLPVKVTDVITTVSVATGGGALFIFLGLANQGLAMSSFQKGLGWLLFTVGVATVLFTLGFGLPKIFGLVRNQPRHLVVESCFAAAKGFDFFLSRSHSEPPFGGILFRLGRDLVSFEVMRSSRLPFVEWGNYRYSFTRNGGKNWTPIGWGYLRMPLAASLPNALFCPSKVKQMRRLSRIELPRNPESFGAFDVYCEPADRAAATAILDADTVQLLKKNKFSFEFADGYFYVYFAGLFRLWKPETVKLLADIVTRVEGSPVLHS